MENKKKIHFEKLRLEEEKRKLEEQKRMLYSEETESEGSNESIDLDSQIKMFKKDLSEKNRLQQQNKLESEFIQKRSNE